ncbi:hypothetical protein LQW54_004420 [Pestalotiopsis sp. IQ-011]
MPLRRRPGRFIEATEMHTAPSARHQGIDESESAQPPTEHGAWQQGEQGEQGQQGQPQTNPLQDEPGSQVSRPSNLRPKSWHAPRQAGRRPLSGSNSDPAEEESLRHLVEFLRRTPPPWNHMSISDDIVDDDEDYDVESVEESRWGRALNPFRRKSRKGGRKRPMTIQLPDSAVASTTSGGYRHIAISIPLEHSYDAHGRRHSRHRSASAQPSEQGSSHDIEERLGEIETRLASIRPYSSDTGVGTVLQPVAEDREPKASKSRKRPARPPRSSSLKRPSSSRVHHSARDSGHAVPMEGHPSPQLTRSATTGLGPASRRPSAGARPPTRESSTKRRPQPIVVVPEATPARARQIGRSISSPRPRSNIDPTSVPQAEYGKDPNSPGSSSHAGTPGTPLPGSDAALKLPPTSTSKRSTFGRKRSIPGLLSPSFSQKSSPGTQSGTSYGNNPPPSPGSHILRPRIGSIVTIDSEPRVMDAQAATAHRAEAVPLVLGDSMEASTAPSSSTDGATSSPLHTSRAVSRSAQTDITTVHHLHKALSRKEKVRQRKHMDVHSHGRNKSSQEVFFSDAPPSSTASRHQRHASSSSEQADTRPSTAPSRIPQTAKAPQARRTTTRATSAGQAEVPTHSPVSILKPSRKASMGSFRSSTTTTSSSSSFAPSFDRLSHLRQTQRRLERDVRGAREALDAAALASAAGGRVSPDPPTRQELQRRHDYLKERRMRDIERRTRRLERNGDLWLRSLPALMETMSRMEEHFRITLQQQQHQQQPSQPIVVPSSPTTRTRATSQSVAGRTSPGNSEYSPESLEPLMRELQEVAKRIPVSPRPMSVAEPNLQGQRDELRVHEPELGTYVEPRRPRSEGTNVLPIPERAPEHSQRNLEAVRAEGESSREQDLRPSSEGRVAGTQAGFSGERQSWQIGDDRRISGMSGSPVYHLAPESQQTVPPEKNVFSLWR